MSSGFRKDQLAAQREYKRKKNQKKAQRLKALEEERETEKNKWMDFNSKVSEKVVEFILASLSPSPEWLFTSIQMFVYRVFISLHIVPCFQTFSKTNKGKVKRSIFATPDAVNGRVGVGTCGIGGKPMTHYTHQEKWTKK